VSVRTAARFDVPKLLSDDDWRVRQIAMHFWERLSYELIRMLGANAGYLCAFRVSAAH